MCLPYCRTDPLLRDWGASWWWVHNNPRKTLVSYKKAQSVEDQGEEPDETKNRRGVEVD